MRSTIVEIQSIHVDSYLEPSKPILQIPHQAKPNEPIRISFVMDHMKDSTPSAILLLDLSLPTTFVDIVDKHWIHLFNHFSLILNESNLFMKPKLPAIPSTALVAPSSSHQYHHIAYCQIHPIYFTLSLESNSFVSVSFQNTPLRFKVKPFTQYTGTMEDYIRLLINALLPSVLMQSPAFVGTLDLIGNPASIVISVYHSMINIFANPINSVPLICSIHS